MAIYPYRLRASDDRKEISHGKSAVLLAGLVFGVSLLATYVLWRSAETSAKLALQNEFQLRVRETGQSIVERLGTYEQVLRGTKGLFLAVPEVTRDAFRAYVGDLGLADHYPGIQGIALSEVVPKGEIERHVASIRSQGFRDYSIRPAGNRDHYTAITMIEPFNLMNQRAFGFDMFSQPIRRAAMEKARDSGRATLSGKVTLVQEGEADVQPGFLMYLPLYRNGAVIDTVEQRRAAITGWVYAPFRVNDFMDGLGGERSVDLSVSIYDDISATPSSCLFQCDPQRGTTPLFESLNRVQVAGRIWTLKVWSQPGLEARMHSGKSRAIAMGGLFISVLFALLVWILASTRGRAIALATAMTRELRFSHDRTAAEQRRMRVILENSHDAFVAIDRNGVITDWNMQAERTFGWTAAEAIGQKLKQLVIPEDQRQAHESAFSRFVDTGTGPLINRRVEVMALHRSGKTLPVELAIAAMEAHTGYTASAFIRDISERKEAQQREAQRQQALEQARAELHRSQKLEAVGKLTGGVAHDFNNVLQIIYGNVQLLLGGTSAGSSTSAQRTAWLKSTIDAVERGSKLSSQLLAFARKQPLQPLVVNIGQLIGDMDNLLRRALEESSIELVTAIDPDLWNARVDPNQLENVVLNLVLNARDAMTAGGRLTITLRNETIDAADGLTTPELPAGQYVCIAIADTGAGMPPEVAEHAFDPFFTTKPEGEGTGLGLSMAYGFVKQSEGHIMIDSEVGRGTTVTTWLPRSLDAPQAVRLPAGQGEVTGGSETVLVVEDDPDVQNTVVATLAGLGYRVLTADDANGALAMLRSGEQVDLLFTDVVMPGKLRGPDLAREATAELPGLAVVFTSGYTQDALMQNGKLEPGVSLLTKPYRREQLARKIREALAARSGSPPSARIGVAPERAGDEDEPASVAALRVLMVEDNHDLRLLGNDLIEVLGHKANGVESGEAALEALAMNTYDVLLADVNLPGMSGLQLARRVQEEHPGVRIVFATGYSATVHALAGEGMPVLTKPYDLRQLKEAIEGRWPG